MLKLKGPSMAMMMVFFVVFLASRFFRHSNCAEPEELMRAKFREVFGITS